MGVGVKNRLSGAWLTTLAEVAEMRGSNTCLNLEGNWLPLATSELAHLLKNENVSNFYEVLLNY